MKKSERLQQRLDEEFNKATSNTAFANDRHQDVARTWFEEGYLTSEQKRKDMIKYLRDKREKLNKGEIELIDFYEEVISFLDEDLEF